MSVETQQRIVKNPESTMYLTNKGALDEKKKGIVRYESLSGTSYLFAPDKDLAASGLELLGGLQPVQMSGDRVDAVPGVEMVDAPDDEAEIDPNQADKKKIAKEVIVFSRLHKA